MLGFYAANFGARERGKMAIADKLRALQIKVNVIADRAVGLMDIEADVQDGVAELTGEVETEEQRYIAEQLAYEVDGVHEVVNLIQVAPGRSTREDTRLGFAPLGKNPGDAPDAAGKYTDLGPQLPTSEQFPGEFSDEQIECEVKDAVKSRHNSDFSKVIISSVNQMVYLSGSVRTWNDLNKLQDVVIGVRGVMGIDSGVSVDDDDNLPFAGQI